MSIDVAIGSDALGRLSKSHVGLVAYRLFFFLVGNMNRDNMVFMSQGDIAERLNVSRESINKAMSSLRRLRFIKTGNKCVEIPKNIATFDIPEEEEDGRE